MKKRIICAILCVVFVLSAATGAMASADRSWESAYKTAISKYAGKYGSYLQLADLDLDGSPELILGGAIGSGLFSMAGHVFTYKNGAIAEVEFDDFMLSDKYTLYRNDADGTCRIEGSYTFREGAGYYSGITALYSYSGRVSASAAFTAVTAGSSNEYYVGSTKVSKSRYDSEYNARNNGWTKVESYVSAAVYCSGKVATGDVNTLFDNYKDGPAYALVSTHKVAVDGIAQPAAAYNINGSNYFKLRDIACILSGTGHSFEVEWNDTLKSISLTTGKSYTAVGGELGGVGALAQLGTPTTATLYVDGVCVAPEAYNINGNNYFKIRDIADVIGFGIDWDAATSTVVISTK